MTYPPNKDANTAQSQTKGTSDGQPPHGRTLLPIDRALRSSSQIRKLRFAGLDRVATSTVGTGVRMSAFRKGFHSVLVAQRTFPAFSLPSFSGSAAISPYQPQSQYEITVARKKAQRMPAANVSVPWFPMTRMDLDHLGKKSLEYGAELDSDHPGFLDAEYRQRRRSIVEKGRRWKCADEQPLPIVDYSESENATWAYIYDHLKHASQRHAISAFNDILHDMEKECDYDKGRVPQLESVSQFLSSRTGFTLRPVSGLLSARDFLNALALKVFFSTQYIRHPSRPLYTPEPDVVHELIGHAPMLADPDFADLSHQIGMASLGATDDEIEKLATSYWFSVEFGLCMEDGLTKAYGAGVLSSVDEIEHACAPAGPPPAYQAWDPFVASVQPYPITSLQPLYFVAESLADAKGKMREYTDKMEKPFTCRYNEATCEIEPCRGVVRLPVEE